MKTSKILIVGPAWVGDMVMAQCLFQLLKQTNQAAEIDVLAPAWNLPLLARMPEVNQSIVLPFQHGQLNLKLRYQIGKNLREKKYDQAIVLPNSFKSALIPFWANIPVRTGFKGEWRYGLLNDLRYLDEKRYPLMIERFMALGLSSKESLSTPYPIPKLHVTEDCQRVVLKKYQLIVKEQPILALCPGAEFGPAKCWPPDYYAEIAKEKLAEGWAVWLFGSPKDKIVTEKMMSLTQQKCVDLAGKTNLADAVDLLSLANIVVSNDSGLMHIAAALQKPLIAIYGATSANFTPPLSNTAKILSLALPCQPCFKRVCPLTHHDCMMKLTPNSVIHAMNGLIN